ncbi:MAG: flagellar motor protein MotB [Betaproteobacteria bacterium HGW-Betaproteobacteria-22]|nr:MAG: flagellar motor protein MotB [Betaproteobacteria bacterium HGW-Betaproteobacteria-22]
MNLPRKSIMQNALIVLGTATLAACATSGHQYAALDEAKASYEQASNDVSVARSAPVELRNAQQALQQAEAAQKAGKDAAVEHYSYLAKQRSETALQAGKVAQAELAVNNASRQRDGILIEARTREAEEQRTLAEKAGLNAEDQRNQAEAARKLAEARLAETQAANAKADKASAQAKSAAEQAALDKARADEVEAQAALDRARAKEMEDQAAAERARAKSMEDQLAELNAKKTDRGMVLTLGDVLFATGKAKLNPRANSSLDKLVAFLQANPDRSISIEGHTDSTGADQYNQVLSERRAIAVKNVLIEKGIDLNRVSARGFGETVPVASNDTALGKQQNRRVEIVILDAK